MTERCRREAQVVDGDEALSLFLLTLLLLLFIVRTGDAAGFSGRPCLAGIFQDACGQESHIDRRRLPKGYELLSEIEASERSEHENGRHDKSAGDAEEGCNWNILGRSHSQRQRPVDTAEEGSCNVVQRRDPPNAEELVRGASDAWPVEGISISMCDQKINAIADDSPECFHVIV